MIREELWLLREKYNSEKTEDFFADCARLKAGEPLAYLIGHIPFLNATIYLDSHPLIPRPETEFWVEQTLKSITLHRRGLTPTMKVLDLCAGSGCVGVAILKALPESHVDFVEIDPQHHDTIKKNIEKNGVNSSRTEVLGGNLFERVHGQYDYILSNPPYIDTALDRAEESVREHEPHLALYGGDRGLALIVEILQTAKEHLTDGGVLVIEHEPEQTESLLATGLECGLKGETREDQFGILRYTVFTRSNSESMAP